MWFTCEVVCVCVCQIQHASLTLGEVLAGDRKAMSDYSIGFKESFDHKELCSVELKEPELQTLREAIEDLYYFEFIFGEGVGEHVMVRV